MIIHQLRIESFAAKIQERMGPLAALLAKIMMNSSIMLGKSLNVGHTEALSLQQIIALLPSTSSSLDFTKLAQVLESMSTDLMKPIKKHKAPGESEAKWSVNIRNILLYSQLKIIEALIDRKFNGQPQGPKAHLRVFRCLQALGYATDKQLEECCLLSIKDVRRVLMELVVEGVVEQHELTASKGLYAYSVKISSYLPLLREKIMKSKMNLEIKTDDQRALVQKLIKVHGGVDKDDEVKNQNHLLKKLIIASYQLDDMITNFMLF